MMTRRRFLVCAAMACLLLTCLCACGDGGELVEPVISGEQLSDWPADAAFSAVPRFTGGVFDAEQSTLKSGNNLLFYSEVEQDTVTAYYDSLVAAGFTDALAGSDNAVALNARFSDEDETIVVTLNYRVNTKALKITLFELVEEEEEE